MCMEHVLNQFVMASMGCADSLRCLILAKQSKDLESAMWLPSRRAWQRRCAKVLEATAQEIMAVSLWY